jgi:hypothetical protein
MHSFVDFANRIADFDDLDRAVRQRHAHTPRIETIGRQIVVILNRVAVSKLLAEQSAALVIVRIVQE